MSSPFLPDNESYIEFYIEQDNINNYYKWACHLIPFITLPIYAEAFYCVFHKCQQFSLKYVRLLKVHMFIHLLGELYWTIFLLPVIVLPGFSISTEGVLSSLFDFSPSWQLFFMCGILQISSATMIHLLIYRLKFAIPPNAPHEKIVKVTAEFMKYFFYFSVIFCTFAFTLLDEDQTFAKERLLKKYLIPNPKVWNSNFVTTDRENPNFKYFLYITCFEILIFSINIITIPTISFHFLSKNQTEKSKKLAMAHKRTLQTLIFQLAIHCIFHLLPIICFTISAIVKTNNIGVLTSGLIIWALHGAVCTFTLVFANKPFRLVMIEHLIYVFCCLCLKTEKVQQGKRRESTVIQKIDISN